jgi:hypothetical protein
MIQMTKNWMSTIELCYQYLVPNSEEAHITTQAELNKLTH